jgi:hypothetical protein
MQEYKPEKNMNDLSVERRNRLSSINTNAGTLGLNFRLISEDLVANTAETDTLIEQAEAILKELEVKKEESNLKLEEISNKIFSSK